MNYIKMLVSAIFVLIPSIVSASEIEIRVASNVIAEVNGEVLTPRGLILHNQSADGQIVTLPIPDHVRLQGISMHDSTLYFAVDSSFVAEGVTYRPSDIIKLEGSTLSIWFTSQDIGLERGTHFSGISVSSSGTALSIDRTKQSSIGLITPRDILHWNGDSLSKLFSGSSSGLPDTVNISAFSFSEDAQMLYLAFSNNTNIEGTQTFNDSIFRFDMSQDEWLSPLHHNALLGDCRTCRINALDIKRDNDSLFKDRFQEI